MTGRYNKRYQTGICYECDRSKYPNGKVIDPTVDKMAQKLDNGKWICGTCQIERSLSLFSRGNPIK